MVHTSQERKPARSSVKISPATGNSRTPRLPARRRQRSRANSPLPGPNPAQGGSHGSQSRERRGVVMGVNGIARLAPAASQSGTKAIGEMRSSRAQALLRYIQVVKASQGKIGLSRLLISVPNRLAAITNTISKDSRSLARSRQGSTAADRVFLTPVRHSKAAPAKKPRQTQARVPTRNPPPTYPQFHRSVDKTAPTANPAAASRLTGTRSAKCLAAGRRIENPSSQQATAMIRAASMGRRSWVKLTVYRAVAVVQRCGYRDFCTSSVPQVRMVGWSGSKVGCFSLRAPCNWLLLSSTTTPLH